MVLMGSFLAASRYNVWCTLDPSLLDLVCYLVFIGTSSFIFDGIMLSHGESSFHTRY